MASAAPAPRDEQALPFLRTMEDADHNFLLELHRAAHPAFAQMLADLARAMADMQLRAQAAGYRQRFPNTVFQIICDASGYASGRLTTARTPTHLYLLDIALLPACRGRGWGAQLIKRLQFEAATLNIPLQLTVARTNPAQQLYRRMGFTVTSERELDLGMTWCRSG